MCAVFGLVDYKHCFSVKQRELLINTLAVACEVRGTDATGFAYNTRTHLAVYKRPLAAHKLKFKLHYDAKVIMGHTRMTTQGSEKCNYNNHPFIGHCDVDFALAHNGVLCNDEHLRCMKSLPTTHIQTDSYIAVQLLEHYKTLSSESISAMAESVRGSFVFTILDRNDNIYFVKGDNPLALYHYEKYGFFIYASTEAILNQALTHLGILDYEHTAIDSECGDILQIDKHGLLIKSNFTSDYGLYSYVYPYFSYTGFDEEDQFEYCSDLDFLISYAESEGIAGRDVETLLEYGYMPEEIEELVCSPNRFYTVLSNILYGIDDCASIDEL